MVLGRSIRQPSGYKAFIPDVQISELQWGFPPDIIQKAGKAERLIGKLDGLSHHLPNVDYFLSMYVMKDAAASSQIEGTRATMMDALEFRAGVNLYDTDAGDILYYTKALQYGMKRLADFPFSLRFIREIHRELMTGGRATHFSDPGTFRKSQNWIGGGNPSEAEYVPPPVEDMHAALNDLERFIQQDNMMPVLQAGILHAQFETIHPFLDGNGRTGRLLITLFLYQKAILEKPLLFLSTYFKKHRQDYYNKLNQYHGNDPMPWLRFYLDGVISMAEESITTTKKITTLKEADMSKIQALGKREAGSGILFLQLLYKYPIVTTSSVMKLMGFSRPGAMKLLERFTQLGILIQRDENATYGKSYLYKNYTDIFKPEAM